MCFGFVYSFIYSMKLYYLSKKKKKSSESFGCIKDAHKSYDVNCFELVSCNVLYGT